MRSTHVKRECPDCKRDTWHSVELLAPHTLRCLDCRKTSPAPTLAKAGAP